MDKEKFIEVLSKELNYDQNTCSIICDVLESHFLLGRKNKEKIIDDLIDKININREEAEKIYELSSKTITKEIKNKLLHPFGSSN